MLLLLLRLGNLETVRAACILPLLFNIVLLIYLRLLLHNLTNLCRTLVAFEYLLDGLRSSVLLLLVRGNSLLSRVGQDRRVDRIW